MLIVILTSLSLCELHGDITFLAARLGRIPVYCLPTVLLLTLRPSPLPNTLYLSLLPFHKWLSRLIVIQAALHSIIYLYRMTVQGTLFKLLAWKNITGVLAMLSFIGIAITSLPWFRHNCYRFFFFNHYVHTWIVVIALYFHSRPSIPGITIINISILCYQTYHKFAISTISPIEVHDISQGMAVVEIPNSAISVKSCLPGCHVRITNYPHNSFITRLVNGLLIPEEHPFTIATLPCDTVQKLIVKKHNFALKSGPDYLITGSFLPFLKLIHPPRIKAVPRSLDIRTPVQKCLIVVGGSAISFALPILRSLSYNGATTKIIWILRDHDDLKILDYFKNVLVSDDCIDIFITGKYSQSEKKHFKEAVSSLRKHRKKLQIIEEQRLIDFSNKSTDAAFDSNLTDSSDEGEFDAKNGSNDDIELGLGRPLHPKKSLISLKNRTLNDDYDIGDDSQFENVDLDLGNIPSDKRRRSSTPLLGSSSSSQDYSSVSSSPENPYFSLKVGNTSSNNGYPRSTISCNTTSSVVYDDLANYWVLKGLSCRIEFGRPVLGPYYYNWCVSSTCNGPMVSLNSGEPICYNQLSASRAARVESGLFDNVDFKRNRRERFRDCGGLPDKRIWVVGAGPKGLVNKVRWWAENCGFQFHNECFSI